jgi:protein TonB
VSEPTRLPTPIDVPAEVVPEEGLDMGIEGSLEGGVEGGIAGGVVGGVVGGLPQAPPPPETPIRVGGDIREPRKVKHVDPVYPLAAKEARIQGVVILECVISAQGKVADVKVLRGAPLLDDAAVVAARQWAYTPTLVGGVPVPVVMTVTVWFNLHQGR